MSQAFWIGDSGNQVLRFVDSGGIISTPTLTSTDPLFTANTGFLSIQNIAADSFGNLYVVDSTAGGFSPTDGVVYKVDAALNVTALVGAGAGAVPLSSFSFSAIIQSIATDSAGNVYIGELDGIVYCVNMQSTTQTILGVSIAAGDIAQVANWAQLTTPAGLCVDSSGNLYIADEGSGTVPPTGTSSVVWKVDTSGANSVVAGTVSSNGFSGDGGPATSALLNGPQGVSLDSAGNIYISDAGNACVRAVNTQATTQTLFNVVIAAGNIQTVAGIPTSPGYGGNGGLAIIAQLGNSLDSPIGAWNVVIGPDGNLYVADTDNFEIRMVNSGGIINSVAGNHTQGNTGDGGPATIAEINVVRGGLTFVATAGAGSIVIVKATSPGGSPQAFTFRPSWKAPFILLDGQSNSTSGLSAGTYSISEDAVSSWSTSVGGGNPSSIVLGAGQTITLTFTNSFSSSLPVCYADGIIPTGAIDGVNTSFTLPNAPNPPGSLILESDTSVLAPGVGFNLSFVLTGTQLTLTYPPKTSLVAWYRFSCGSQIPPLYKLLPSQAFDDNAFIDTPTAINSTYFTYGFVNAAKSAQNPLLGFHRKRFTEIQMNVNGSGQFTVETFPNYILKQDLSYNPYAYVIPPILLQTDPPDDIIRPLNSVGNRVYVMFQTNTVGASFDISKAILVGVMDSYSVVNPNSG